MTRFEQWASSMGYNLEKLPDGRYKDPITRAAKLGYLEGCGAALDFWKREFMNSMERWVKYPVWDRQAGEGSGTEWLDRHLNKT